MVKLHDFGIVYHHWMEEKPLIRTKDGQQRFGYTHKDVRAAYRSLLSLQQRTLLFNYLTPPPQAIAPDAFVGSTHHLEGGFNAEITLLARLHRR